MCAKDYKEYFKWYKFSNIYVKLSLQISMQAIYLSANLKNI